MKVVIQGYNTCCQNVAGGVQVRIRKIASLLKDRGVEVELFNPFETDLRTCDVLHVFSLNLENWALIKCAKQQSKLVVMSSIVPIIGRAKLMVYKWLHKLPIYTAYSVRYESLQMVDVVIAETPDEADFLHKFYSVPYSKIEIIPNGLEIVPYSGKEIYEVLGGKKDYILQVGRFDSNKNQLNVIKAMRGSGIDVVFVGGADHTDMSYYSKCEVAAAGYDNIHLLGWLEPESPLLKSAYANAKIIVLPSFYETFGLVALEGGMAGAGVVLSNTLPIRRYPSFKDCPSFSPQKTAQIADVLVKAFNAPRDSALKEQLMKDFNWDTIIEQHINIYARTIS